MSVKGEANDARLLQLQRWLSTKTDFSGMEVVPASEDASFRRYFRILDGMGKSWIAMDAPPEKENSQPFVEISRMLRDGGVRVPEIFEVDLEHGFLVLEDFGAVHFEDILHGKRRDAFYNIALSEMVRVTSMPDTDAAKLPHLGSEWLQMELDIFHEWFLNVGGGPALRSNLEDFHKACQPLVNGILEQPNVFVHRDFHCRNLLLLDGGRAGVIDFQGAMSGPLTYDLASLLRDCYQDNPRDWVEWKAIQYKKRIEEALSLDLDDDQFLRWLDWTGLQRHLKVLGLFNRLNLRDGKSGYQKDIPRVWEYAKDVLGRYAELSSLREFVEGFNTWSEAAA